MNDLKTDPKLLNTLERAAKTKMTAAQKREQTVSFVMSSFVNNEGVTREKVREILAEQYGE